MSDREKLERIAANNDPQAYRALFEKFGPIVKAFMMRQGTDAATAEELAQETMLNVWRKASLYSLDKGSVTTWIFAIARNLRIDQLRKEKTWVELPDTYVEQASSEIAADEAISSEQERQKIKQALDGLPKEQREVVVLSFIEGLPHRAIAERLQLPVGTIKSRIRLAYLKLRTAVGDPDE
ncbi:sigma-70 family RNA polymerase sigma factor [Hyphomicrobium sp.]|uniref:RNA polymerase sigma factor n=1 Tax=Hyphomicrobium sp. TaxID=82 RepID=UPI000F9B3B42|nr:sigma-70 family RNA polymerase sigma factor [Hyphomicrobium sp.]RUO98148.1 MAG: sigma-70 family RNA polymerase sigma factor [Hyphomicrobium sp.]